MPPRRLHPRIGQQAPRIASTLGLVSVGLGVALVPASIRRVRVNGLTYRRLQPDERPAAVLNLALRRGDPSPVVRNFFDLVWRAMRDEKWKALSPSDTLLPILYQNGRRPVPRPAGFSRITAIPFARIAARYDTLPV